MNLGIVTKKLGELHFARGGVCVCVCVCVCVEKSQTRYRNGLQAGEGLGEVGWGGHNPGFQIPEAETWAGGEGGRKHLMCCQQLAALWILSLCCRSLRTYATPEVTFPGKWPKPVLSCSSCYCLCHVLSETSLLPSL